MYGKTISLIACFISISLLSGNESLLEGVGFAEAQGCRPTMEDAHDIKVSSKHAFFGLYDGHGGREVADHAAKHLQGNVMDALGASATVSDALRKGFVKTHDDLKKKSFAQYQGCCALVALVKDETVYVASAGDSRAVLCTAGKAVALSDDHKPDRPDEKARIEGLGGKVTMDGTARVNRRLAISRSIGDWYLHPYVIPNPEIMRKALTKDDEFLVIACDGVWDVMNNQTAVDIIRTSGLDVHKAAALLKDEALKRGSTDNVSVMVVNLRTMVSSH
jgi:protein phosphatase 1L